MRKNLFFKISYLVFVVATIALTLGVICGVVWARLTVETEKLIAVTIMAVSGAIMGFLLPASRDGHFSLSALESFAFTVTKLKCSSDFVRKAFVGGMRAVINLVFNDL